MIYHNYFIRSFGTDLIKDQEGVSLRCPQVDVLGVRNHTHHSLATMLLKQIHLLVVSGGRYVYSLLHQHITIPILQYSKHNTF